MAYLKSYSTSIEPLSSFGGLVQFEIIPVFIPFVFSPSFKGKPFSSTISELNETSVGITVLDGDEEKNIEGFFVETEVGIEDDDNLEGELDCCVLRDGVGCEESCSVGNSFGSNNGGSVGLDGVEMRSPVGLGVGNLVGPGDG
mmetsp:Transcript_2050/g.2344  ORF Transcript_2050/g.2344 Transcript_2050/m.2344 type:complete len:143 (-) Transcript_2050:949-1377(-)